MEQIEQENADEGISLRECETSLQSSNRRQESFTTRFRRRSHNITAAITTIFLLLLIVGTGLGIIDGETLNALKPLVEELVENQQTYPNETLSTF